LGRGLLMLWCRQSVGDKVVFSVLLLFRTV
jgi:hypothetical protein